MANLKDIVKWAMLFALLSASVSLSDDSDETFVNGAKIGARWDVAMKEAGGRAALSAVLFCAPSAGSAEDIGVAEGASEDVESASDGEIHPTLSCAADFVYVVEIADAASVGDGNGRPVGET